MADREIFSQLYTKHKRSKIKLHRELRNDPQYRQKKEKTKKERERIIEVQEAELQIKEFLK